MSEYGSYDVPSTPADHGENMQPTEQPDSGDVSTIDFSMAPSVDDTEVSRAGVDPVMGLPFWHPDATASPMTAPDGTEAPDAYDPELTDGTGPYKEVLHTYIDGSPITDTDDAATETGADTEAEAASGDAATAPGPEAASGEGATGPGPSAAAGAEATAEGAEPQPEAREEAPPIEEPIVVEPFYILPEERTYLPKQWRTSKEDLMGYDKDLGYDETYQKMDREKLKETLKPVAAAEQDDPMRNIRREQEAEAEAAAAEAELKTKEAEAEAAAAAKKAESEAAKVTAEAEAAAAAEESTAEQLAAEAAVVAEAEKVLATAAAEAGTDTPDGTSAEDGSTSLVSEGSEDELTAAFASESPVDQVDPAAETEDSEVSDDASLARRQDELQRLRDFIEGDTDETATDVEETPGIPTRPPGSQYTLNPDGSFSVAGPVPDVADPPESDSSEGILGSDSAELTNASASAMPDIPRDSGFGDRLVEDGFAPSRAASADSAGTGPEAGASDLVDSPNVGDVAPTPQGAGSDFDRNTASTDLGLAANSAMDGRDVPGAAVSASSEADPAFRGESDQAQSAALASPGSSSPATATTASAPAQSSGAQPDSDPTSGDQTSAQQPAQPDSDPTPSDGDPTAAQVTAQSSGSDSDPSAGPATSQPSTSQQPVSQQAGQDDSASQPASSQQRGQDPQSDASQQQSSDPSSSGQSFRFSASAAAASANTSGRYVTHNTHPTGDSTTIRVAEGVGGIIAGLIRSPARALGLKMDVTAKPIETIFGKDGPLYEVVVKDRDTGSARVSTHRVLAPSAAAAKLMVQLTIPKRDIMG